MSIINPYRTGMPRLPAPERVYDYTNEKQFRLGITQLLQQLVQQANDTVNYGDVVESTLQFIPDNTYDVGDVLTPYRPRTVYGATSVVSPLGSFTTRVTSPLLGTTSNADVVFDRNSVTQLTLSSLLATFAGDVSIADDLAVTGDITSATLTTTGNGLIGGDLGVGRTPTLDLDVVGQFGVSPSGVAFPTVLARGIDGRFYTVHDIGDWGFVVARAANDTFAANLTLYHTRDAAGGRTALVNGDGLARITFQGVSQTGGTVTVGAAILATVTGTVSNGVLPTELTFHTAATGDADEAVERMALTSAGHWIPGANGSYDLGSSSFRMRSGYFGTELVTPSLDSGGAVDLVLQRNNVTQLTLGSLSATFAGDLTVSGDNLNVNGLTYTWPSSQSVASYLTNNGSGTLSWTAASGLAPADAQYVTLATNATLTNERVLVASDVLLLTDGGAGGNVTLSTQGGTFGAGAYTFPSTLVVTSTLTQNGTSALLAQGATADVIVGAAAATSSSFIIRGAAATQRNFFLYTGTTARWNGRANITAETGSDAGSNYDFIAYNDAGSQIDIVYRITRAANGSIAFASNRPITGGTYNGQTISSAASFTGTLVVASDFDAQGQSDFGTAAGSSSERVRILGAAGSNRDIGWYTGATRRWLARAQSTAESGSNAGTPFVLMAFDDAGSTIDSPLTITRAAGGTIAFSSGRPVTMGSSLAITGALSGVTTLAMSGQLTSTLATGTAPFSVASTTKVANLNADLLDDQTGSYYLDLANASGTLDETLGGTGLTSYTLGDLLYASASNTLSKLAGNTSTTGMYLKQTGTGAASAAPVWDTLTAADVGAGTFSGGTFTFASPLVANSSVTINSAPSIASGITFQASGHIQSSGVGALTLTSASGQIECADDIDLASGQVLRVNGTQVIGARETGWATSGWAGTPARTAFDTTTVTLPQLAAVVQAILEDLGVEGHGAFDVDVDA